MNILRCHIRGFGRLSNLELAFCPGLNLIFAPNEGGKSTLQHFLLALLYGQFREDIPHRRHLEDWVEHFKPWRSADYGGILWCRLAGGAELEILRTFGREEGRIEIRTGSGEDITGKYERRKNGDVLFAHSHLGMPKDLFDSVAVVRENRAGEFHGPMTIRDRIANLTQTGDEALSVAASLKRLHEALEELGSERAPTKPYRLAVERLGMLRDERKALEARWTEFHVWVQERNACAAELVLLDQELRAARRQVAFAQRTESAQNVSTLEKIEAELRVLRQEIGAGAGYAEFPAHLQEELSRLAHTRSAHEQRMDDVQNAREQAEDELRKLVEKRQVFATYASLNPAEEPEKVTEWFIRHKSLSGQIRDVVEGLARRSAESAALEQELGRLGSLFRDPNVDWRRKAHEADEAERAASQRQMALAEELGRKTAELGEERSAIISRRTWGAAGLILALALAAGALVLLEASFIPMVVCYTVALALALRSLLLFRAASRSKFCAGILLTEIDRLKSERERLKGEAQKAHFEIGVASVSAGFREVKEFLAAAQRAGDIRSRLEELRERIAEAERLRDRLASESAGLLRNIQATLEKVGLACSADNLGEMVDTMRDNLRRFTALDAECQRCGQKAGFLREEESRLRDEWNQADVRIREILAGSGQDSLEAFYEACRKHRLLSNLKEREASLVRERDARCENRTLEEWKKRLELSESQLQDQAAGRLDPLSVEEAERDEREVATRLASCRESHARLVERTSQAFRNFRTASEIDEDVALAERDLQRILRNRDALTIALETIEDLSRRQQEDLAPQLNHAVGQRFLRLCGGRYREVKIDPEFQVWFRDLESGELRSAEALSRGTQDQLYFALRFGVLDLVSNGGEPCPCLLDEPFAAYDRLRLGEAFQILKEEAMRRQLILFTCRDDLLEQARVLGAHIVSLSP